MTPITEITGPGILINGADNIEIVRAQMFKAQKLLKLFIKPHRFLNADEIRIICDAAKKKYGGGFDVECGCDYAHLKLDKNTLEVYKSYLEEKICKGAYIAKCGFVDAVWNVSDDDIVISTKYGGGKDILMHTGCGEKLRLLLKEETFCKS